ncbi:hypothetical protein SAMN05216520_11828 [Kandleria vitulina]|jgi:rhodanese-related sulfurtransferase|uniref:rhodanese-like domain-containing protein n=1 Tax=Kandleria vitulina TaxID=1630 RepID=UPI00088BD5A3|nr:rhodanese-like domain-containing protein [Kandleria vitulina]SDL96465.1 hypothetical protein SAMN05216520_11828 [Kandleria vitulina]
MLFGKKDIIKSKEINEAYKEFEEDTSIILLCVDEQVTFDECHPVGAQCFPLRIIEDEAKKMLDKDLKYYVYALRKGTSYTAAKKLVKLGYNAYDLGSSIPFRGPEEGFHKKNRRKRKK